MELNVIHNPSGLEELQELNPMTTIIIGGDVDMFKSCGFYYSFYSCSDEELESFKNNIINTGIKESYAFYQALYNEEVIANSKKQYGSTANRLKYLLTAFKNCDYTAIQQVLSYGLDDMLEVVNNLTQSFDSLDNDSTWEIKYQKLVKEHSNLVTRFNKLTGEVNRARKADEINNNADYALIKNENESLKKQLSELQVAQASFDSKVSSMVSREAYDELYGKLDLAESKLAAAVKELEVSKTKKSDETNMFIDSASEDIISTLRERINTLENSSNANYDSLLPVIDDKTVLAAKSDLIFYFKDLKNVSFVGSLIEYFKVKAKSATKKGVKTIVIVYDPLNGLSTVKYRKYGYSINEDFEDITIPVVVTNNLSKNFLRDELQIASYNCIVVIDRLGTNKCVINRKEVKTYYLINTPNDIVDYQIKAEDCIAFFNSDNKCFIDVIPDDSYAHMDKTKRLAQLVSSTKFKNEFKIT